SRRARRAGATGWAAFSSAATPRTGQALRTKTPRERPEESIGSSIVDADDEKLVTLARAARVRTGAAEGAAVRDDMGRTYAAATVALTSLSLSAVQAAAAAAVSSGVQRLEAAAVVTEAD